MANINRGELDDPHKKKLRDAIEKAMAKDGLDIDGNPLNEEPDRLEPIVLYQSGIEPMPAQEQIKEYLEQITPPDAHKKRFRFEAFLAGIAFTVSVGGIIVIVLTLLGMGG